MIITSEPTAKEVLIAAKKLIEDPNNWCQRSSAEDANGLQVSPYSDAACKFCAIGAIDRTIHDLKCSANVYATIYHATNLIFGKISITDINDKQGHAAVMTMFDKAIEIAENETA